MRWPTVEPDVQATEVWKDQGGLTRRGGGLTDKWSRKVVGEILPCV